MSNFKIFYNPPKTYKSMLKDIKNAKKSVMLETYIYGNDKVGKDFRDLLIKKAKQGIKVQMLIDAWGSRVNLSFFRELIKAGGKVRMFSKIKFAIRIFTENHKRDHRKILIIDDKVTYIGSANITSECLDWRESIIRLKGKISEKFGKFFKQTWEADDVFELRKEGSIFYKNFEIISDTPSHLRKPTQKKYLKLIKKAKREILIETPYFVPPFQIRRALQRAAREGVRVVIIIPHASDVKILDIIKERYFGRLHKKGIEIFYYTKKILHSKVLVVDRKYFIIGSSNVDYRSFVYQYEANLFGNDKRIAGALEKEFFLALKDSRQFNYSVWKNRPWKHKLFERFLYIFKRIL